MIRLPTISKGSNGSSTRVLLDGRGDEVVGSAKVDDDVWEEEEDDDDDVVVEEKLVSLSIEDSETDLRS